MFRAIFSFNNFFIQSIFKNKENVSLFIILVLSNSYLFLENTNSIDYPIALFFLSIGFYFLKSQKYFLAYFFGITIASRANFLTFIYPSLIIFFFNELKNRNFKNLVIRLLVVTIVGLIFYYPLFDLHNYSLNFLDLPFLKENDDRVGWYGGPSLQFSSLFPRFIYKIYLIFGIFSIFYLLTLFIDLIKKIQFTEVDNIILLFIVFINIFIFYFILTKVLIINPFIIFSYIVIFKYLNAKNLFLNIFQLCSMVYFL